MLNWFSEFGLQTEVAVAAPAGLYCCEGAVNGRAAAPNGCKWLRPKKTAQEEEKEVYHVSGFSADTMCVPLPPCMRLCLSVQVA